MNALGANSVLAFAVIMDKKLQDNSHKEGWCGLTSNWMMKRIRDEMGELKRAIERNVDEKTIQEECADIANFAMMIADNYEQEETEEEPPKSNSARGEEGKV